MRVIITLSFLLTFSASNSQSKEITRLSEDIGRSGYSGIPFIHNFTPEEFGRYAQYWGILQLPGGEMAFSTHGGVRIYDGYRWSAAIQPPASTVVSLDYGMDDNLYIGGIGEFGYVVVDSLGEFKYHSLKQHIPEQYLDFSRILHTVATEDGVYFRSPEYVFRWDGNNIHTWKPSTRFGFLGHVNNKIFAWQENLGLYILTDGEFELLPDGGRFADHYVRTTLPYDENHILIGTRTDGFYLFDGETFERWQTDGERFITNNVLYHGSVLNSGNFAFGTLRGGVAIIERNGRLRNILDRNSGLADQSVLYTYVDRNGSLWIGFQNGISRVEPDLPITIFDERNGIDDFVLSIKEHRGIIYAGTNSGVYTLNPEETSEHGHAVFKKVPGLDSGTRDLAVVDGDILAATYGGIYRIDDDHATLIGHENSFTLLASRLKDGVVYIGQPEQVLICRYHNGSLTVLSESGRIPRPINLAEDNDGSVFVGTNREGVYRLKWEYLTGPNGKIESIYHDVVKIGLPPAWREPEETRVFNLAGNIRVATLTGLYKIDEDYAGLTPDTLISGTFPGTGREVFTAVENNRGRLYFSSYGYKRAAAYDPEQGVYTIDEDVLSRLYIRHFGSVSAVHIDSFDNLWIGGSEVLYRVDTKSNYNHIHYLNAKISQVLLNADSLIYRGSLSSSDQHQTFVMPYTDNNLRFRFFISSYEDVRANRYQTKLEPVDEDWSRWTGEAFKDYTNLREGRYTFKVRGRDLYGNVSEAAFFEFRVLPPWYRTWWSYGMAGLVTLLFLYSVHQYRVNRLLEIERTRSRIARDLHDDIGSSLSSVALMIDMVSGKGRIPDKEKAELENIGGTARDMVDSLRDVVWVINPEHDKLNTLIERMKSTAGNMLYNIDYSFDTNITGTYESIGMDFKRSVLMIYKEALNNIMKHSQAKNVRINVQETDGLFRITIDDDGIGFDTSSNIGDGNGLQNMRYRAQQINAKLTIESLPGEGTTIVLKAEIT